MGGQLNQPIKSTMLGFLTSPQPTFLFPTVRRGKPYPALLNHPVHAFPRGANETHYTPSSRHVFSRDPVVLAGMSESLWIPGQARHDGFLVLSP